MWLGTRTPLRYWVYATLAGLGAAALRVVVHPMLGDAVPLVVAFPVTVLSALSWGTGPGLLTAALCGLALVMPWNPWAAEPLLRPLQLGVYLVAAGVVCVLCGKRRWREQPVADARLPDTPLTAWLRAVLWGAVLMPVAAFLLIAWWGFERVRHDAEIAVAHAGDVVLNHALRTFAVAAQIAARADAASPFEDASVPEQAAAMHRRLADMAAGAQSIVNINVWDAQGRPIARSDRFPVNPEVTVADRRYFLDLQQRGGVDISEVITGRQTGQQLTNLSIRRYSADGRFRGVVAVSLSPSYFRDYYLTLTNEEPGLVAFTLVRSDGAVLAQTPASPGDAAALPADSAVMKVIASGAEAGKLDLPATGRHEAQLAAFRRVGDFPVYVVAGFSKERLVASWLGFVSMLAAIVLPLTAVLVYVSWIALKKTRWQLTASAELNEQTQRRAAAERNMLESQKLETLAFVTSGVAHDFNNLLAIVSASLHVLRKRQPELASEKYIVAMGKAIQSGVRLTRQLLSFSRKQALRPETVVLQSWLPSIDGLVQSTLGSNIERRLEVDPDTAPVHVDIGELELAIINLVVNARHAMPQGGLLAIRVCNAGKDEPASGEGGRPGTPMVSVEVQDTGVGIPAELLDKVLQPFFTTRSRGAGSGLGLSQVHGFCTEAGGGVHLRSEVGRGTVVCMRLPAASGAQPSASPAEAEHERPLHGCVLLVEDNEDVASTTELVLRTAGLEVVRVSTADAALAHLASTPRQPDLVLSDIAMPGAMNGIGLAFELRKRLPALPVILNTGYAEQLAQATEGGLRVLQKPIAPSELLGEIESLLAKSAA